jgi:hypothetical protein
LCTAKKICFQGKPINKFHSSQFTNYYDSDNTNC